MNFTKLNIFRALRIAKSVVLQHLESLKMISRKIKVAENVQHKQLQNFSATTEILREINFDHFEGPESAFLTI